MVVLARAWQMLGSDIKNDYKMRVKEIVQERFSGKVADWSIPMSYAPPPGKNSGAKVKTLEADAAMQAHNKEKMEAATTAAAKPPENEPANEQNAKKEDAPKAMRKLSGTHTPFHQKTIETKSQSGHPDAEHVDEPSAVSLENKMDAPKIKVETDMQLSEDFRELD